MKYIYILIAYCLKFLPFIKKYQFRGYVFMKNKNIILNTKMKYSNLNIRLNIGDYIQYHIFMTGCYEEELLDFFYKEVSGKIFVDIGANIGNFTLGLCKSASKIYAIEASSINVAHLNKNLLKNKIENVQVIHRAIDKQTGKKVKLFLSPDAMGNNSLFNSFDGKYEEVETISLDDFCEICNVTEVDIIKIDVEGSEYDVILGAQAIIKKCKPIISCEFNYQSAKFAGWSLVDLYTNLIQFGYTAFIIENNQITPICPSFVFPEDFCQNIIFIFNRNIER